MVLCIDLRATRPPCPFIGWSLLCLDDLLKELEPLVDPDEPAFIPQVFRLEAYSLDIVIIAGRGAQIEPVHVFHSFDQVVEPIDRFRGEHGGRRLEVDGWGLSVAHHASERRHYRWHYRFHLVRQLRARNLRVTVPALGQLILLSLLL